MTEDEWRKDQEKRAAAYQSRKAQMTEEERLDYNAKRLAYENAKNAKLREEMGIPPPRRKTPKAPMTEERRLQVKAIMEKQLATLETYKLQKMERAAAAPKHVTHEVIDVDKNFAPTQNNLLESSVPTLMYPMVVPAFIATHPVFVISGLQPPRPAFVTSKLQPTIHVIE